VTLSIEHKHSNFYLGANTNDNLSPGRFFVSHELKMCLFYLLTHYDVEHIAQRPPNMWIGNSIVPPMKGTIRMRRKAGTR